MWDYIILGIVQGVFEWLPVSSEGMVAIVSDFFLHGVNPVDLALFLHLGTLFSVLIYFRKDWKDVAALKDREMFRFLLIATVISLAVGLPLYTMISDFAMGSALLFIMGSGLLLTSWFHRSKRTLGFSSDRLAIVSGFLQGLAVIPGLSRSGSTVFGLSLGRLSPREILRVSYMMSVPVVLASSLYLMISKPVLLSAWPALISSFLAGVVSLHFLMRISQRISFFWFTFVFAMLCYAGALLAIL